MKTIAILGATSHIAKSIIINFIKDNYNLVLFGRDKNRIENFCLNNIKKYEADIKSYDEFVNFEYDVVINCVGISIPEKQKKAAFELFKLSEDFDNLIMSYLNKNKNTLYINISSGAVYNSDYSSPIESDSISKYDVNINNPSEYYGICKFYSEKKHRSLSEYNIIDLRVFSYFSRFIDLNSGFFMSELMKSLLKTEIFKTNNNNIIRDYIHPLDLYNLVLLCIDAEKINKAFDVYSCSPVEKFEILDKFSSEFDLKYAIENISYDVPTGNKNIYYSKNDKLKDIGYYPVYSSIEALISEAKGMIELYAN